MPPPARFPARIAVVIRARTPRAFWQALRRAERQARVAELRLDSLPSLGEIARVLARLARRRRRLTLIATCRSRSQGGEFTGSGSAQLAVLDWAARAGCAWVDVEAPTWSELRPALRHRMLPSGVARIVSFHDFDRTPKNLERLYRRLSRLPGEQVKIAVRARSQRDNLRLLALARRHRRRVIALAMGSTGLPGRILGLRAGSALTYAPLEASSATAPGQLPLQELRRTYRVDRLTARTRIYGVVGDPILHSLSPALHNAAFQAAGLDAVYLPFEVKDLRDFLACVEPLAVGGFSVTRPHKQALLAHLDGVDPLAEAIGAVNTVVVRKGGKLYGYNTDYVGVLRALEGSLRWHGARVLVLGAGGSARAVAVAVATAGGYVSVCARRPNRARELARRVGGEALPRAALRRSRFDVIVNCTPVGQAPEIAACPLRSEELNCRVLFDLVYNPRETELVRRARRRRIPTLPGWRMLVEQGAAQFELWTGLRAPLAVMEQAVLERLRQTGHRR